MTTFRVTKLPLYVIGSGGGSLFYSTNIVCQISPLFRRACSRSEELAMLKRKASGHDVTNNIFLDDNKNYLHYTLNRIRQRP